MADLLTLADAKAQLNISSTTYDTELGDYISATTDLVEAFTGPMSSQSYTETVSTHSPVILLTYRPIISISSITALYSTWPSFTAAQVTFDPQAGTVWRIDQGTIAGAYTVVYTAGRTSIPKAVNVAARIIVQHLWDTQRGSSPANLLGGDDVSQSPEMYWDDIPNRAKMLLRPYMTGPAIA